MIPKSTCPNYNKRSKDCDIINADRGIRYTKCNPKRCKGNPANEANTGEQA